MKLTLNSLSVRCILGDLPEERITPREVLVDVELTVPDRAGETDELGDTVDYAALAEKIRTALIAAKCRLIERAVKVVAEVCLNEPLVKSVHVSVTKPNSIPGLKQVTAFA